MTEPNTLPPDDALTECGTIAALRDAVQRDPDAWIHLNHGSVRTADEGAAELARSPELTRVVKLTLHTNNMTDAGVASLAASEFVTHVRTLDLSGNYLTHAAGAALATSKHFERLERIDLGYTPIGAAGAVALSQARHLTTLRRLDLPRCHVKDEGAIALATSPTLTGLRTLNIFNTNQVTAEGYRVLGMSRLDVWSRRDCLEEVPTRDLKALAREHGLRGYSKLKKDALIEALLEITAAPQVAKAP